MFSYVCNTLNVPLKYRSLNERKGAEFKLKPEVCRSEPSRLCLFSPFRSAPVCKHASKACDPVDAFRSDVQSGNGGVWWWAWLGCVAVKMSMDKVFHHCRVQGTTLDVVITGKVDGKVDGRGDGVVIVLDRMCYERGAVGKSSPSMRRCLFTSSACSRESYAWT